MHDVRPQSLPFALSIITDLLLCLPLLHIFRDGDLLLLLIIIDDFLV